MHKKHLNLILTTLAETNHTQVYFHILISYILCCEGAGEGSSPAGVWDLHGQPDHCSGRWSKVIQTTYGQQVTSLMAKQNYTCS